MDRLQTYVSVVPNRKQKTLEEMGFYAFVHFGMNTFTDTEWGTGKEDPRLFNPASLDTDQWCEALKSAGAQGVILTAKHHDGFCLWQTQTTEHSVKNSPYKNGKGDVVAELSASCAKYGLKMGLYLSPWDRNSEFYGTDRYNDFYVRQLTELLTNYGPLFTVWLDGACGSYMDGKPVQKYDFDRYYRVVEALQPDCAISNCGPDVRWVGNEAGMTRASEWNVVPLFAADVQKVMANSQQGDDGFKNNVDVVSEDIGSRAILAHYDRFMWYPAEVDVSIRPGWFYHKSQDGRVRSVDNLLNIYYNAVGGNCMLLLNVPPDRRGMFHETDVARLNALGERVKSAFAVKAPLSVRVAPRSKTDFDWENMLDGGAWSPAETAEYYRYEFAFDRARKIDKTVMIEDIDFSQRVEKFTISSLINGKEKTLYRGTTVGHKKIALFKPVVTDNLILTVEQCRLEPYWKEIAVYEADGKQPRRNPFGKIIRYFHRLNYKIYVARIEKAKAKRGE